ncbi:hypothetical protein DYB38_008947 [Aphanomyces astaci]|uniref:PH domain-containing protein n=1 Tax=Aphanomyces astaci TaxID=112090 RepID=A0A397E7M3_APHAT|nr:hypothetical protein DYB34_007186 [Aphanomyces astaci]RHY77835.1 hypothetical protein DYB38_008947 [Aphanomyces astaci]
MAAMLATRSSTVQVHRSSQLEDDDLALIDEVMAERCILLRRTSPSAMWSPRSGSMDNADNNVPATAAEGAEASRPMSFAANSKHSHDDTEHSSSLDSIDDADDVAIHRSHLTHPTLSMLQSSDSLTSFDDTSASSCDLTAQPKPTDVLGDPSVIVEEEASGRRSSVSTKFVVRKGWIEKCGQRFKTWKWRYFELTRDGCLRYYTAEDKAVCKGSIQVEKTTKNDIVIQTHVSSRDFFFVLSTPLRNYLFSTASERAMTRWIRALESIGAQAGPGRWDPLRNTVHLTVDENHQAHKWRGYDDPHDGKTPMAGFLLKRGHVRTNWVQRYFKLEKLDHHPVLRYFLHDDSSRHQTAKGAISLVNAYLSPGIPCCSDGRRNYFMLHSGSQELHLNALTEGDMRRWIHALANAIQLRPTSPPRPMHVVSAQAVHVAKQLPRVHVTFESKPAFESLLLESRGDALVVSRTSGLCPTVPLGAQLLRVDGVSVGLTVDAALLRLARATYPLPCEFIGAPVKRGDMVKRSRSSRTLTSWKTREVVVEHGFLTYLAWHEVRDSFSLAGCYLQLPDVPGRPHCVAVGRSPADKLVLQAASEDEQISWAATLHCSIVMASQGLSVAGLDTNEPFSH